MRPTSLHNIVGQNKVKTNLTVTLTAANKENRIIPHILLNGPPGLGKTTFAQALANDSGRPIQLANAAAIRTIKDILPFLMKLTDKSILFIDEIHSISNKVEEFLYTALEDFKVYLLNNGEPYTISLAQFTMIGATTDIGLISKPFRDRFPIVETLEYYSIQELKELINRNSQILSMSIDDNAQTHLARVSRGTPRVANGFLSWIKDCAVYHNLNTVSLDFLKTCLKMRQVDDLGLTATDRKYLDILKNSKGPMGISTIAATTGIAKDTIEQVIEPYLLMNNLILRTPRGRICVTS